MLKTADPAGSCCVKERILLAMTHGEGWQDHPYNPVARQVESRTAVVERYDDLGSGCSVCKQSGTVAGPASRLSPPRRSAPLEDASHSAEQA
jgi:hypothetical protein